MLMYQYTYKIRERVGENFLLEGAVKKKKKKKSRYLNLCARHVSVTTFIGYILSQQSQKNEKLNKTKEPKQDIHNQIYHLCQREIKFSFNKLIFQT